MIWFAGLLTWSDGLLAGLKLLLDKLNQLPKLRDQPKPVNPISQLA